MFKKIAAIIFIYIMTVIAWMILFGSMSWRSTALDKKLKGQVRQLWGKEQRQQAPAFYYYTIKTEKIKKITGDETVFETKEHKTYHNIPIDKSDIKVDLSLEHRKKGLLWYSTYKVGFKGTFEIMVPENVDQPVNLSFIFPNAGATYDNFNMVINGNKIDNINIYQGKVQQEFNLSPGETAAFTISYNSQGLEEWWYEFGKSVSQVKKFNLEMKTDFKEIDFPPNGISPTNKKETDSGWILNWKYENLLSGVQIGMIMPQKLNPGPWAAKITSWAWISLFLFFFLVFIISIVKEIKIHPMHYLFIAAAFFSFHLLLAYLIDHISIHMAFAICSVVSIFLVISYMKIVVGAKHAFISIGISQFVYLVLFSYTFFFEKFTGLAVSILCIITLFLIMQFTAKVNWEQVFAKKKKKINNIQNT